MAWEVVAESLSVKCAGEISGRMRGLCSARNKMIIFGKTIVEQKIMRLEFRQRTALLGALCTETRRSRNESSLQIARCRSRWED